MEPILNAKAVLGEGPCWVESRKSLYWVDILQHEVHIFCPSAHKDEIINVGQRVGAVVPRNDGNAIVVLEHGFYNLDLQTQALTLIAEFEMDKPNNRFNDGKCDAKGRFWAGTMDMDEGAPSGSLYCFEPDYSVRTVLKGITVSNGLGWSPDNETMYYIDSPTREVAAFDYDLQSGTPINRRVIIRIEKGLPDGMTIDEEGMIWIAHWGGYQISRWDPNSGKQIEEITLPCPRITSCTFGGDEMNELYITSARVGLSADTLSTCPTAGGLFKVNTGVKGLPSYAFGG